MDEVDLITDPIISELNYPTDTILFSQLKQSKQLRELKQLKKVKEVKQQGDIFNGKSVCFTGIRDKKLEEFITSNGGKISSSVSSKTSLLIHADDVDKSSSKFKNDDLV